MTDRPPPASTAHMKASDLLLYLFGNRGSVERIASSKRAWLVGAILVFSAGIARNYDHLDLRYEVEWFLGPFIMSLFSTVFIFLWLILPLKLGSAGRKKPQLLTFLSLVWLTAPCAWVYGIPVESLTDIVTATKWNIAFLAVVALWRVAIIVRAVSVLTGVGAIRVLPAVLAPAALESCLGSMVKGASLVGIMGGVRLPPHNELLLRATNITIVVSFWLFIACFVALFFTSRGGAAKQPLSRPRTAVPPVACFIAALACLGAWLAFAPPFQQPIRNRNELRKLILSERYEEAVAFASSRQRSDFSDIHELPPGVIHSYRYPLLDALDETSPGWLRDEWYGQALQDLTSGPYFRVEKEQWDALRKNHPGLIARVEAHAEAIRSGNTPKPSRHNPNSGFPERWLKEYDRETRGTPRED